MKKPNRRHFIALALGAAGAGGMAAFGLRPRLMPGSDNARGLDRDSEAGEILQGLQKAERKGFAFGTEIVIAAFHAKQVIAKNAVAAAFDELEVVEALMSIYEKDSQVCRLNREGELKDPHHYLVDVLERAQGMGAQSRGAFDVTVQPLWSVYSSAQKKGVLPSEGVVQAARKKVDWRALKISKSRVKLMRPNMAITLNGIAQGFATDRALAVLRDHGVTHAMVNTGEVGTLGYKDAAEQTDWRVGIQHPRVDDALIALAELHGGCLATSGDYATVFSPDREHHHIFDPRTGHSPKVFSSVTVVAPNGMDADSLSTAAFVCDLEGARTLVENAPGAEAMFIRKDGSILATSGFPKSS